MDIRDEMSIAGVVVALGLGVYNALREDKCFDILRTALETQTLQTKELTALYKQRQRLRLASMQLSPPQKDLVDNCIAGFDKAISSLETEIASDKASVIEARKLTALEAPDPELVKKVNPLLGLMRVRHSAAVLGQATTDGLISDAEDLLAVAQV